jgi:hypothetical protein
LIFQKHNYFKISVIAGVIIISSLLLFQNFNSCPAKQFSIIDEIIQYESTMDPNICVSIAEKIDKFNYECSAGFETLECG